MSVFKKTVACALILFLFAAMLPATGAFAGDQPPEKPVITVVVNNESTVTVYFEPVTYKHEWRDDIYPASGYKIMMKAPGSKKYKEVCSFEAAKKEPPRYAYTITGLKKGKKYSFKVNAKGSIEWGPYSKVKTVKLKKDKEAAEVPDFSKAKAGDTIIFGSYEQDNDLTNGAEPIEWLVLSNKDKELFIISKYALDCRLYEVKRDSEYWDRCDLRKWLNNEFYNSAFNKAEKKLIRETENETIIVRLEHSYDGFSVKTSNQSITYDEEEKMVTKDKVFIPSLAEMTDTSLGFGSNKYEADPGRICAPTAYAIAQGAWVSAQDKTDEGEPSCWWFLRDLRSDGVFSRVMNIHSDGTPDYYGNFRDNFYGYGIRPALKLSVKSSPAVKTPQKSDSSAKPGKPVVILNPFARTFVKIEGGGIRMSGLSIIVNIGITSNAEGYEVYLQYPGKKDFDKVGTVDKDGATVHNFMIYDLKPGDYSVKVRAYSKSGGNTTWGDYSDVQKTRVYANSEFDQKDEKTIKKLKGDFTPSIEIDFDHYIPYDGAVSSYTTVDLEKPFGTEDFYFSKGIRIKADPFSAVFANWRSDTAWFYDTQDAFGYCTEPDIEELNRTNIIPTISETNVKGLTSETPLGTVEEAKQILDAWLEARNAANINDVYNKDACYSSSYGINSYYIAEDGRIVFGNYSHGKEGMCIAISTSSGEPAYNIGGFSLISDGTLNATEVAPEVKLLDMELLSFITPDPYDAIMFLFYGPQEGTPYELIKDEWIRVNDLLFYFSSENYMLCKPVNWQDSKSN